MSVVPVVDEGLGNSAYVIDLGGGVLQVITTPGHSPEHLTYLLVDRADLVWAALTIGFERRTGELAGRRDVAVLVGGPEQLGSLTAGDAT